MVLRIPLRRSVSLNPEHQPPPGPAEMTGPAPLKMEANVLVMGADSVGKSESIYSQSVTVEGREVLFNIWDFPYSQEQTDESCAEEEKRMQWADGFVVVYSICDRASFNMIRHKVQHIKATKEYLGLEKLPIVIVGNKRDLHHRRTVSSEEGRLLALSMDCEFYEVSAAEAYHGTLLVFHGLVDKIKESKMVSKKGTGIRGIVKSMSAVFARRRTDSL
ncbi:ras-related and estrogen-regulated growth inhibitor-like protein isoform X1 [Lissotriton helveticus]